MKFKFAILITFALISIFSSAASPWTLLDCIEYAHAHNIQIKRTQLQAEISKVNKLQAYTNILPDLNANVSRNYSFGRQIDPFTNEYKETSFLYDDYRVTSRLSLFNGLQNYNNIKSSEFATLAAIQNVEKEKVDKTIAISSAYLEILFQQELAEVARSQQGITQLQVDRTRKLVDAGSVAKGDLLEIQAQLANENLNVTNSENLLQLSMLNLVQLLDLDSVGGFDIVIPDTVDPQTMFVLPQVRMVYSEALNYLPHVKSAEYQMNRNEKNLLAQKGRRSPTLYVSGSIYTGYSDQRSLPNTTMTETPIGYLESDPSQTVLQPGFGSSEYPYGEQFKDNIAQSVNLGISIPILNRWEVNNSVSRARLYLDDSQYELEQVKQQLYQYIQQAHSDALSARDKFFSATEAVNSYRESFHYTEQKFNVGIVNSVEYNIAKNNFIKAESDLLQAKYEFVFSTKILDLYRGIPISL